MEEEEVGGGGTTPALPAAGGGRVATPRWTQKGEGGSFFPSSPLWRARRVRPPRRGYTVLRPQLPSQYSTVGRPSSSIAPNPTLDEVLPHHPPCNGLATTYYCW